MLRPAAQQISMQQDVAPNLDIAALAIISALPKTASLPATTNSVVMLTIRMRQGQDVARNLASVASGLLVS
jgi:hypothetical protein